MEANFKQSLRLKRNSFNYFKNQLNKKFHVCSVTFSTLSYNQFQNHICAEHTTVSAGCLQMTLRQRNCEHESRRRNKKLMPQKPHRLQPGAVASLRRCSRLSIRPVERLLLQHTIMVCYSLYNAELEEF